MQYILMEIKTNIHIAERHIYRRGLKETMENKNKNSLINCYNFQYSRQKNSYDCGIYVAIYVFLLAVQDGLGIEVNWKFPEKHANSLRKLIKKDALYGVDNLL
jgi:Ulp1 family protease